MKDMRVWKFTFSFCFEIRGPCVLCTIPEAPPVFFSESNPLELSHIHSLAGYSRVSSCSCDSSHAPLVFVMSFAFFVLSLIWLLCFHICCMYIQKSIRYNLKIKTCLNNLKIVKRGISIFWSGLDFQLIFKKLWMVDFPKA